MSWIELSLDCDREAVESISALLAPLGYNSGVVIEEPIIHGQDGPEYEFDLSKPVTLRIYVPNDAHVKAVIEQAEQGLWPLRMMRPISELRVREVREEDWANAWKAYYRPQRIGEKFVVVPSWEEFEVAEGDLPLLLDPGMAFGTGLHPTTRLCLQLLEQYAQPDQQTLDLGCGSGILAIALAKLGAQVLALDNDPIAVEATAENVRRNGVEALVTTAEGSLGAAADFGHWMGWEGSAVSEERREAREDFDLIAANILAKVHVALAKDYVKALRSGGLLITSGIIIDREPEVHMAFEAAGLTQLERHQEGDWVALVHRR